MTFTQVLSILWVRRWVVLGLLAVTVAATVAMTLWMPKQYKATAQVLVDVKSPDPLMGVLPGVATPSYLATQVEIIESDRTARRVIETLRLDQSAAVRQNWLADTGGEGDLRVWLTELLQKRLVARPSRESSIVAIGYRAADPQFAAAIANGFARAYIEIALELKTQPAREYATWFDARTRAFRDELERAQSRLSQFQRANGILATDERFDVETARLNELSTQLTQVQGQLSDARSRQNAIGRESPENMPEVLQNGVVQALKSDIARAEGRLKDVSSRLGGAHPQVQAQLAELASLRLKLEQEIAKVATTIGTATGVNRQRETEVRAALEAQRARVLRMKQQRDELAVLQRDVEAAQRALETVTQRFTMTSLESQSNQTNVSVLTPAVAPIVHDTPRMGLNVAAAVVAGLLLGSAVACALELARRRVRTAEDLAVGLGVPVLATVGRARVPGGSRWFGLRTA